MGRPEGTTPNMPTKAKHPVNCIKGGKHQPNTREIVIKGEHIKYSYCRKCSMVP